MKNRGPRLAGPPPTLTYLTVSNKKKNTRSGLARYHGAHVFAAITMLLALPFAKSASQTAIKPNVILIFSDDMGYSDLPHFGKSEIPTPALDRLAKEGITFTNAYVTAPICVASRMGLMTGQFQQRFGIYGNIYGEERNRLMLQQTLLPKVFQDAGYRTSLVGKWHLSGNGQEPDPYGGPGERGFDEFVRIPGGGSSFWEGTTVYRNGKAFPAPEYLTDFWGTEACEFIDRNQSNPFFLYLAFNAVHAPMNALESDREPFAAIENENRRTYNGMLVAMDRSIGRVLERLDQHGISENTIVLFLNDNGGGGSTTDYAGHSRNFANNLPLQGHKFDLFEGGIRVPMLIRWPGQNLEGKVYPKIVSSVDVFPTVVHAAGLDMPESQPTDGVDLLPYMNGKNKTAPHEWLCWQSRNWAIRKPGGFVVPNQNEIEHNSAIRKGKWKMVRMAERIGSNDPIPSWQLYDLFNDIGEQQDLVEKFPAIVSEMDELFLSWRSSMPPSVELN